MPKKRSDLPNSRSLESSPGISLGVAVIRRAIQDLTITGVRNSKNIRKDAFDFLVYRLWEVRSLWAAVLQGIITKKSILESVERRCRVDSAGNITPTRKQ